jgi:hypothetical protein
MATAMWSDRHAARSWCDKQPSAGPRNSRMTDPNVGRCLGSGRSSLESSSVERVVEHLTGLCVCLLGSLRDPRGGGDPSSMNPRAADQRESIGVRKITRQTTRRHSSVRPPVEGGREDRTTEGEMRGAQPPDADPEGGPVVEDTRLVQTGNNALRSRRVFDEVNETGSGRSARPVLTIPSAPNTRGEPVR